MSESQTDDVAPAEAGGDRLRRRAATGFRRTAAVVAVLLALGVVAGVGVYAVHRHDDIVNAEPLVEGGGYGSQAKVINNAYNATGEWLVPFGAKGGQTAFLQLERNDGDHAVTITGVDDGNAHVHVSLRSFTGSLGTGEGQPLAFPYEVAPGGNVVLQTTVDDPDCHLAGQQPGGTERISAVGLVERYRGHSRTHEVQLELTIVRPYDDDSCLTP